MGHSAAFVFARWELHKADRKGYHEQRCEL